MASVHQAGHAGAPKQERTVAPIAVDLEVADHSAQTPVVNKCIYSLFVLEENQLISGPLIAERCWTDFCMECYRFLLTLVSWPRSSAVFIRLLPQLGPHFGALDFIITP